MAVKPTSKPVAGIFYMVPDPKTGTYILAAQTDEETPDPAHFFYWETVVRRLGKLFRGKDVDLLSDTYLGLPRGRISYKASHDEWYVLHGDDFPIDTFKEEICAIFGLTELDKNRKVSYSVVDHEKMDSKEKSAVEQTLGIKMTKKGFSIAAATLRKGTKVC